MSLAIGFSPTNIGFLPTDYRIIAHQLTGFYPLVLSGYHPPQWASKVRHYWVVENVTRARVLAFLIRFNTQQEFATLIPVKISQNQTSRGEGCSACYTSTVLKLLNIQHTPKGAWRC